MNVQTRLISSDVQIQRRSFLLVRTRRPNRSVNFDRVARTDVEMRLKRFSRARFLGEKDRLNAENVAAVETQIVQLEGILHGRRVAPITTRENVRITTRFDPMNVELLQTVVPDFAPGNVHFDQPVDEIRRRKTKIFDREKFVFGSGAKGQRFAHSRSIAVRNEHRTNLK